VAVGDQADQRLPDEVVLADDDRLDLGFDCARMVCELFDRNLGRWPLERGLSHLPLLVDPVVDYWVGFSDEK
jgi:hypothetical protein